jgi:hypothetical protein
LSGYCKNKTPNKEAAAMSGITEFNRSFGISFAPVDEREPRGSLNLKKFYFMIPVFGVFAGIAEKQSYGLSVGEKVRIGLSTSIVGLAIVLPLDLIATLTTQVKNRSDWHKNHPKQV